MNQPTHHLSPELAAALEITREQLASTPVPAPPPDLVRRWHAALAELPAPVAATPVTATSGTAMATPATPAVATSGTAIATPATPAVATSAMATRQARRRVSGWLLAAASVFLLVVLLGSVSGTPSTPSSAAGAIGSKRSAAPTTLALHSGDPRALGPLADPVRLAGCLAHIGVAGEAVLDARELVWHGTPAVRLVLPDGAPGRFRMLVVTPDCGPDSGRLLGRPAAGH